MASKKTSSRKTAAVKKSVKKKKPTAAGRKGVKKTQATVPSQLKKIGIGVLLLVAVCLTAAMVADLLIRRPVPPAPEKTTTHRALSPETTESRKKTPFREKPADISNDSPGADHISPQSGMIMKNGRPVLYEVFEETADFPKQLSDSRPQTNKGDGLFEIALIIDDIGYDQKIAMALYQLEPNISFSVLPWSPYGRTLSRMLLDRGAEVMLHLPMEPLEYPEVDPGPGALLTGMSPDELMALLEKNLNEVPGASGVNNHMGSRLTTEASQMYQIFSIFKKRDLFFVDSMTAPQSQCRAAARLFQVRFGERDVFLDNIQEQAYITGQFAQLKKIAQKHGRAIGIGHPYPATLETLKVELPKIKGKFRIIPVSRMVAVPG